MEPTSPSLRASFARFVSEAPAAEFVGRCLRLALTHAFSVGEASTTILGAIVFIVGKWPWLLKPFGTEGPYVLSELTATDTAAYLVCGLVALRVGLSPYWAYREISAQRDQAITKWRRLSTPALAISFDPIVGCEKLMQKDAQGGRLTTKLTYGVTVKNLSGRTVEDVRVQIRACRPADAPFLPATLQPHSSVVGRPPEEYFRLHPHEECLVNLAAKWTVPDEARGGKEQVIYLCYLHHGAQLHPQRYVVEVVASGRDVPPECKFFTLDLDAERFLTLREATFDEARAMGLGPPAPKEIYAINTSVRRVMRFGNSWRRP